MVFKKTFAFCSDPPNTHQTDGKLTANREPASQQRAFAGVRRAVESVEQRVLQRKIWRCARTCHVGGMAALMPAHGPLQRSKPRLFSNADRCRTTRFNP